MARRVAALSNRREFREVGPQDPELTHEVCRRQDCFRMRFRMCRLRNTNPKLKLLVARWMTVQREPWDQHFGLPATTQKMQANYRGLFGQPKNTLQGMAPFGGRAVQNRAPYGPGSDAATTLGSAGNNTNRSSRSSPTTSLWVTSCCRALTDRGTVPALRSVPENIRLERHNVRFPPQ